MKKQTKILLTIATLLFIATPILAVTPIQGQTSYYIEFIVHDLPLEDSSVGVAIFREGISVASSSNFATYYSTLLPAGAVYNYYIYPPSGYSVNPSFGIITLNSDTSIHLYFTATNPTYTPTPYTPQTPTPTPTPTLAPTPTPTPTYSGPNSVVVLPFTLTNQIYPITNVNYNTQSYTLTFYSQGTVTVSGAGSYVQPSVVYINGAAVSSWYQTSDTITVTNIPENGRVNILFQTPTATPTQTPTNPYAPVTPTPTLTSTPYTPYPTASSFSPDPQYTPYPQPTTNQNTTDSDPLIGIGAASIVIMFLIIIIYYSFRKPTSAELYSLRRN